MLNLKQTDTFTNSIVEDQDFELALKVIRTVRNACLGPNFFDAAGAVTLSYAHAKLVELAELCNECEEVGVKS